MPDEGDIYGMMGMAPDAAMQARALAAALRRQQTLGALGTLAGQTPVGQMGATIAQEATSGQNRLMQGMQHGQELMARLAEAKQARQEKLDFQKQQLDALNNYRGEKLGLEGTQQGVTTDASGNPITYSKHGQPGGVGAPLRGVGGGDGQAKGPLSPEALDQAANMFLTTGTMPSMGMGKSGTAIRRAIMNRAAELDPQASLAGNKAGFGADTASLKKLQSQTDSVNAFENTALKNLDLFLGTAKSIVDTGSPLFNMPARKFAEKVAGDPKLTAFNTARQVAVQEISKVLSGAMGNTAVSDSARHEASSLLGPDASIGQIEKAALILKQDMSNRRASMDEQIRSIRGRTGGGRGVPVQTGAATAHPQDSAAVEWAKAHPEDPRAAKILQANGAQ